MIWLAILGALVLLVTWAIVSGRMRTWVGSAVEARLGGYRQDANAIDLRLPERLSGAPPRVAVIGGGLAGIGAASALAERGIPVTVLEANPYLGGKIGAWKVRVGDEEQTIDHGFHAFFRQYYNLNRFLERVGILSQFKEIEDYLIIDTEGRHWTFGDVDTVPVLNIVDLGRRGFFGWGDVMAKRVRDPLTDFVRFDMDRTYAQYDGVTFKELCDEAGLPDELRVSFRTFARAFFADEAELSAADVLRAFHFYYLGHDRGLMYDYPVGDYEASVLSPIRQYLESRGVEIRLDAAVNAIEPGERFRYRIGEEEYDWVVLAANVPGMQSIVRNSPAIAERAPEFVAHLEALETSRGYSVWRLWTDRDLRPGLPTFTNVERRAILDSVTAYHRITDEARDWAARNEGAVLELHSYAIAADIEDVKAAFLEDLYYYFPELEGMTIHHEVLQVRTDFPAFAPGQWSHRPDPETPVDGFLLAGDWVRLPYPMTHMEAAFTSGLVCANAVLAALGLQQEPIESVAPRGLLATKPKVRRAVSAGDAHLADAAR